MFVKFQKQELHVVCHELDAVLITHPWKVSGAILRMNTTMIVLLLVTGIANYINYYNNERYQWNLKNLTPVEYQNQAT